jgi:ADP-ribose pyrophosphatase
MKNFEEKTIKSELIYDGKILKLRLDDVVLPNGRESKREIIEHQGGVCILAIIDDFLLFVEQYRKAIGQTIYEIPAGKLEKGEDPIECAKRELIEETGYKAGKIKKIFSFYTSPGFTDEELHLFLAEDLYEVGMNLDVDEIIKVHMIAINDIPELIRSGKIKDGKTIIALLAFLEGLV